MKDIKKFDEVCNNCQEVYGATEDDCGLCGECIDNPIAQMKIQVSKLPFKKRINHILDVYDSLLVDITKEEYIMSRSYVEEQVKELINQTRKETQTAINNTVKGNPTAKDLKILREMQKYDSF